MYSQSVQLKYCVLPEFLDFGMLSVRLRVQGLGSDCFYFSGFSFSRKAFKRLPVSFTRTIFSLQRSPLADFIKLISHNRML